MTDDMRELYQATILDHNKRPRNTGRVERADGEADGHNPLCGDKLHVSLRRGADGAIEDVRFEGEGCAISRASASLMTEAVRGRREPEVRALLARFHALLTGNPAERAEAKDLGKLAVFAGVHEFPMRVKCATLAWHTLAAALSGSGEVAKTE
jgi:nitrogen fixation NifU-like protein